MKYSIITICGASHTGFRECFNAVINQTNDECELIVVGQPPQAGLPECELPVVKLKIAGNRAAVLKSAVGAAKGEYLLFVDAGDIPCEGWLKEVDEAVQKSRADAVIFGFTEGGECCLNPGKGIYLGEALSEYKDALMARGWFRVRKGKKRLLNGVHPGLWCKCWRRQLLAESLLAADERLGQDIDSAGIPALLAASSIYVLSKPLYQRNLKLPATGIEQAYIYMEYMYQATASAQLCRELRFLEQYIARMTKELLALPASGADKADFYLAASRITQDKWYEKSRRIVIQSVPREKTKYLLFRRGRWAALYKKGKNG